MSGVVSPQLARALRAVADRLRPKPRTTVSEWADRYRRLSSLGSPEPGPWRTARAPYLREILDSFHPDDPTEWLVLRFPTQTGKSEAIINAVLFYMHQFPRPLMVVQPTEQAAVDFSEQRLSDAIKASPALRRLVTDQHTRDAEGRRGKDAALAKGFPGGMLFIASGTSKPQLASKPTGVIVVDEVERLPRELQGEGSPILIVTHRSQNFADRKIALVSTPGDEDDSPITDWLDRTDKRLFEVPCPRCGVFQALQFRHVQGELGGMVWPDGEPEKAHYECRECGEWIGQHERPAMLAAGTWVATATPTLARSRGYHLSALYSPWVSWASLAQKFVAAQSDPVMMRDFVTLDLAEPWRHASGSVIDESELAARAEDGFGAGQPVEVPGWVQVLTAFTDVQDDRLEVSIWGWDASSRACLIGHWILWGDPTTRGSQVWSDLSALLLRQFRTPGGMLPITAGGIDSGWGASSDVVCEFIRQGKWQRRRVFATKGLSSRSGVGDSRPIWSPPKLRKGKAAVVPINVAQAKMHVHLRLAKPGMVCFPRSTDPALPVDYFEQVCSEELIRKSDASGHTVRTWRLRRGATRNEAWDCLVGAYAAFMSLPRSALPLPCEKRTDLTPCAGYTAPAPTIPVSTRASSSTSKPSSVQSAASKRQSAGGGFGDRGRNLWARLPGRH